MGEAALVVQFGDVISPEIFSRVQALSCLLEQHPFPGFVEQVPAFTTVTVYYNPKEHKLSVGGSTPFQQVARLVKGLLEHLPAPFELTAPEIKRIPVCYGGDFGPDLQFVAQTNGLTPEEVVALHTQAEYLVYMIGFAPGFPYLGGMNERIAAPRKASPRASIPAGSVGIAGNQTGIYPLETPGGWQLIGRTPVPLFNPNAASPSLLKAGDVIKFYPITASEFKNWKETGIDES